MRQLIRCVRCDEIFMKTPFDQWPEYEVDSTVQSETFQSTERDDLKDFLKKHRGHRMEDLKIIDDSFVSDKAYLEPVKISYFKATNGKERFVIKKFRERIDEPLRYQLIFGDYSLKCIQIEIQSEAITRQLESEFRENPIPPGKISSFLKLYRRVAGSLDIKNLERVSEESSNPLEVYYKPDDVSLVYLLRNCRSIFEGRDYLNIEEFINRHKEDGVLLLKAVFKIHVKETSRSKKGMPPFAISLRNEKAI